MRRASIKTASLVLCWFIAAPNGQAQSDTPGVPEAGTDLAAMLERLKMPGVKIDIEKRCVDVESTVCLDKGALELIACTKDSKEHESVVAIGAKAMHVHTALLLLGSKPGNPAIRKLVDESGTRWVDVPPSGDAVDVFLVFAGKEGKEIERPISDFIVRSDEPLDGDHDEGEHFPTHTFLFAGSHLHGEGPGPRSYLSDQSGNVISIATFGDETLCLPEIHSHQNGALLWQIEAGKLPAVGSKVTLRLRPQNKSPADSE